VSDWHTCSYCGHEGPWTKEKIVQPFDHVQRRAHGLGPLVEPLMLCGLCYGSATGSTRFLLYGDSDEIVETERALGRYLNTMLEMIRFEMDHE
jgi:hypothetical protein